MATKTTRKPARKLSRKEAARLRDLIKRSKAAARRKTNPKRKNTGAGRRTRTAPKAKQPPARVRRALAAWMRGQAAINPRRKNSRARSRRGKNPDDAELSAAAEMFAQFHGKEADKVTPITELERHHGALAELGRMIELTFWLDEDQPVTVEFSGVRLACSPDGGQLYFIGAQKIDLAALGKEPKDHVTLGLAEQIAYHTRKGFHDFDPIDYYHDFAEEGGELPVLAYDALNEKLYLTGGSYRVKPEGIVD